MTKVRRAGLQPTILEIPDHWSPQTALAVFELIDHLRDQIWSRYGLDIQDELRSQLKRGDQDPPPPSQDV